MYTSKSVFLPLHRTEDALKYSSSLLAVLHTLPVSPVSLCHCFVTQRWRRRRPGSVFAIIPPARWAGARELRQPSEDVVLSVPEDVAHSHSCEEVVSFLFHILLFDVKRESEGWRDVDLTKVLETICTNLFKHWTAFVYFKLVLI